MSSSADSVSVPVKLLHEAEGHPIIVEIKSGDLYRGHLDASEDSMNVHLSSVIHTARNGQIKKCVRESWCGRAGWWWLRLPPFGGEWTPLV